MQLGDYAPTFNLSNQNGDKVSLDSFRGVSEVLLFFFPKADTPGCTRQVKALRDVSKNNVKRNIVIFGISPDPPRDLRAFIDKFDLPFSLLSDPNGAVCRKYQAWSDSRGFVKRSHAIVGKSGRLVLLKNKVKPEETAALLTSSKL